MILNRLDAQHTGEFAQRVAGGKALPAAIVDQIVQRTDGVPLFIEELTVPFWRAVFFTNRMTVIRSMGRFLRWPSHRACRRHCWLVWIDSLKPEK